MASDYTQGILKRGDNDQMQGGGASRRRTVRTVVHSSAGLRFTSKKLYRRIELYLARYVYDGKKCILMIICELANWPVDETNGLFGDLLHLVSTSSSSHYERLPHEFYRTEELVMRQNCAKYKKHCPNDPLEAISQFFNCTSR